MKFLRLLACWWESAFFCFSSSGSTTSSDCSRSRVAIFLAFVPLLALFLWSVWKVFQSRKPPKKYIDVDTESPLKKIVRRKNDGITK